MNWKTLLALVAALVLAGNAIAQTRIKKQTQATTAEITDAVKAVQEVVQKCTGDFYYSTSLARIKGGEQDTLAAIKNRDLCRVDAKEKIKAGSKFILSELGKRKLRDLGADYLVQASTTLDAIGNEDIFSTEKSKLNTLRSRIDLELSTQ